MRAATSAAAAPHPLMVNSPMIGPASSAMSTATGTSTTSTQLSSAEAIRPTRSPAPSDTAPASTGTTIPASAPPTTTSKTMLGTWLAVKYAEVRQLVPTVCASAYCLAKPVTRASTVIAPMTSAPPATPRASLAFRPPEGSRVNGSDVNGSRVGGAAAQHVDPVEHLVARDDLGEADLLRGGGERGHGAEQREPAGTAQLGHGGQAQQRSERVGAGVAEHGPLAQVVGEQRGRGAERHGGQRRRGGRVSGHGRRQQRPAGEQPDLDSPAGPQV